LYKDREEESEEYDLRRIFTDCVMSNHGDDEASVHGDGFPGRADARDKHRALTAVLKDALHPLNVEAPDMRRELADFFDCLESYFMALGIDDVEDEEPLHERSRLRMLNAVLGPKAKEALDGLPESDRETYVVYKKTIQERFLPAEDDVGHLCALRQCTMREEENTKAYVNRLRALASRLSDLPEEWRVKAILASLRLSHKNAKLRDLFAEKMPDTIQKAEQIAESFEIRAKERPSVDKFHAALGGASNAVSVDGVARGYWTRGGSTTVPSGRPCTNPSCTLRRCKGNPCLMSTIQCHTCGNFGHMASQCPQRRSETASRPPQRFIRGRFSRGAPPRDRGRQVGEAYAGYLEQAEQQQFDTAWGPSAYLPEFNDYSGAQAAYFPTEAIQTAPAPSSYPYRAPMPRTTGGSYASSTASAGPLYHPTGELQILSIDLTESVSTPREWWHSVKVGRPGREIFFKMDTGAHGNVIALRDLYRLGFTENDLQESHVFLRTFSQDIVQPVGALVTDVTVNGRRFTSVFHVVPHCASPLFSFQDIVRAGLLELPPEAFTERPPEYLPTNEFNAYKYETIHLELSPNAVPRQFPPRRVPLALESQVLESLRRMESEGIIEKVTYPTPWCNTLMVTPKPDGSLRVCIDPRYLNKFLVRPIHPFPDVDQIFSRIRGHKFFAKIDLTSGFWNLRLDSASADLCTFATPWGRFKFLRLPFGVSPAPEVFHRIIADLIQDLPGVIHYIDDILIMAETRAEHDRLVAIVLRRLAEAGFAVNEAKSDFGKSSITFLGHVLSGDGIRPDPSKLEALRDMRAPRSLAELQSLMGFLNFLGRYIPQFATLAEPIRRIQSKKVLYAWGEEQQQAFEAIRQHLLTAPVLAPFDPTAPLTVATDASNTGLGGVLLQHGRPIMFVARSLSPAETRYAAIEKELLAVRFVLERCHFYTYGRPIVLQTDHKPLLGLADSDLDRVSLRMRRMLERLFLYDLKWEYVPGAQNIVADFLSRMVHEPSTVSIDDAEATMLSRADAKFLQMVLSAHPFFHQVAAATASDPVLNQVRQALDTGWPTHARGDVAPYWPVRHLLRTLGPFVMFHDRICVPTSLRPQALALLHQGHPGVALMQERARQLLFWPKITREVYDFVLSCIPCASTASARPREPMIPSPAPMGPGDQVAADFCSFRARCYLIFYDVFSHFPFCFPVARETSQELIRCARTIFLQTGLPSTFASDNGGAFASQEFQSFLATCGTQHRASSPRYPQSNGAAERAVQTVKRILARCHDENDLFRALLFLQNTHRPELGASPSELFFGRRQRTPITPVPRQFTQPWTATRHNLEQQRLRQAKYYDRCTRPFSADLTGCQALLRDFVSPVVVVSVLSPAPAPRAYYVRLPSGTVTIRNQCFLRPLPRLQPASETSTLPSRPPGTDRRPHAPPPSALSGNGSSGLNEWFSPGMTSPAGRVFPPCPRQLPTSAPHSMTTPPASSVTGSPASLRPSPATGSRLSSGPGSPDGSSTSWASAPSSGSPSPLASAPPPPAPASPVAARPNLLGYTRTGRGIFPSLRAREAQETRQWNPLRIVSRSQPPAPPPPPPPEPPEPQQPT
jgi:transposase InsO family protein